MQLSWLSTRELVGRPGAALKSLSTDGAALITANGKPRAILIPVNEVSFLEDITSLIGFLAAQGAQRARNKALADGRSEMSDADIDEVISKSRAARRSKS